MHYLTREELRTKLPKLEEIIGVKFKHQRLLETACVHTSYVNEHKDEEGEHNERLEFLGDAVLELVATEFLYEQFPNNGEGDLTSFRSALVKGAHLAQIAREIGLGDYLLLSRGEEKSGGREKNYLLANTLEALIGALQLDQGFDMAEKFIRSFILVRLDEIVSKGLHVDAKSRFQELAQEKCGVTPTYMVLAERGPDHNKIFEVGAYIGEDLIGKGEGSSKQNGEQDAAVHALENKQWNEPTAIN